MVGVEHVRPSEGLHLVQRDVELLGDELEVSLGVVLAVQRQQPRAGLLQHPLGHVHGPALQQVQGGAVAGQAG